MTAQPLQFVPTLPPEEVARANFYGLLARLFYAPPDADLLAALGSADELEAEEGGIGLAWQKLSQSAARADPEAVREEYEETFVGTGKSPVSLYAGAYLSRHAGDTPLAELRGQLWQMGLERQEGSAEPEDHVAALCDTMRHLIASRKRPLEEQKAFFDRWLWPVVEPLCAAINHAPATDFYRSVAGFFREICALEHMSFEML